MRAYSNQINNKGWDDIADPATRDITGHTPALAGRANRNVTLPDFLTQEIRVCSAIAHLHVDATAEEIQAAEDEGTYGGQG